MKAVDTLTQAFVSFCLMAKKPFREIAQISGVSVGFVSKAQKLGLRGLQSHLLKASQKHTGGRPTSLSARDRRKFIREVSYARKKASNFSAKQLSFCAGLDGVASKRTFEREMRRARYRWLNPRRKGVLHTKDLAKRVKFCKEGNGGKVPLFLDG